MSAEISSNQTAIRVELVKELKLPTAVLSADLAPDERRIFAACLNGGVYQIMPDSGNQFQIGRHESYASGVCFLPRAQQLISAGYDGVLQWHRIDEAEVNEPANAESGFDALRQIQPARGGMKESSEPRCLRSVQAHRFWSWKIAVSADEHFVASVTGQYLAGGYKYEPAEEREPSVKVFDAESGELVHQFPHVPPVLSLAFSPDGRHLAAANMMGEVRIWELRQGRMAAQWTTPDFTSWGTIKSHHYIGGIFALRFTPDGDELLVGGMGPMTDPMAGNGKQTWQRFAWRENPARKSAEIADGERGNGLMETIAFHPHGKSFLMAGRLAQGKWNAALFGRESGKLEHSLDTKMRVTEAKFTADGARLLLAGAVGQEKKKDGRYPDFGRLKVYTCRL